jgi:uncharacterized membrane protein
MLLNKVIVIPSLYDTCIACVMCNVVLVFSLHGIPLSCLLFMLLNVYLIFGMPITYQVCSADVMSVLSNWFCFIYGIGTCVLLSGVVFQISGYKHRCMCRLCVTYLY